MVKVDTFYFYLDLILLATTYDPVTFVINGNEYNLTSAVLTVDMGIGNNTCVLSTIPLNMEYWGFDWLLGDPFIRQWCHIHDVQNLQQGFAPALPILQLQRQFDSAPASSSDYD